MLWRRYPIDVVCYGTQKIDLRTVTRFSFSPVPRVFLFLLPLSLSPLQRTPFCTDLATQWGAEDDVLFACFCGDAVDFS